MIEHLPIILSAVFRLLSLIPIGIIFCSVFKTFWDRLHSINGLRPYRVIIMIILAAIALDQMIFSYFDIKTLCMDISGMLVIESPFLLFNSGVMLTACSLLYFLFRHASKKEKKDCK